MSDFFGFFQVLSKLIRVTFSNIHDLKNKAVVRVTIARRNVANGLACMLYVG